MSKRTTGTFRDYLRTRSNEPSGHKKDCSNNNSSSRATSDAADADVDDDNSGQENGLHENENLDQHRTAKELLRLAHRNNSMRSSTYSTFINNMHGLKAASCTEDEDNYNSGGNNEGSAPDLNEKRIRRNTIGFRDSNENEASNNDDDEENDNDDDVFNGDDKNVTSSNNYFSKNYPDEESHMKTTQFETTDNWYASASDLDDSDALLSKTYGQNTVNPVLECVNQVIFRTIQLRSLKVVGICF